MSEVPVQAAKALKQGAGFGWFEGRLFQRSPLGIFGTAIAIFIALFGSFEAAALLAHYPLADQLTFSQKQGAWPATIMCLLVAVALGSQQYARMKEVEDGPALERILGSSTALLVVNKAGIGGRVLRAGCIGAIAGFALSFFVVPSDVRSEHLPVFIWFALVMALLGAMFGRGVVMTRTASSEFALRAERSLKINLLHIDELSVIGKITARHALTWASVAAVICLFFVGGSAPIFVIMLIVLSAGMALFVFFRSLTHVHQKIRDAKQMELKRIRHDITAVREEAVHDHRAAARLQGLIAYETRIEAVREWPFDQSTLLRVGAYVLIPAAPAAGQFMLKYFTEHFVQ